MKWPADALESEESVLRGFLINLMEELQRTDEFLTPEESQGFLDYYRRFHGNPLAGASLAREVRGGVRGTYGYTLSRILRGSNGSPLRILDAGCGFGTECLLFALAGAEVMGVDLRPERHEVACKRPAFYEEQLGRSLNSSFRLSSIFNLEERGLFDLIWVHNSITHIHPVEGFLELCSDLLAKNGELVIIDVNKMSLRRRLRPTHKETESLYTTRRDPATGDDVVYAVERDLTLPEQCRLLQDHGFDVALHECYVGFHARCGQGLYQRVLRPLNRSMLFSSLLGGRYQVVGRKSESSARQIEGRTA